MDIDNPDRGPLLIISGEKDHTVPWAIAHASYKQQQGHALTIDSGWRDVAETALRFIKRFV